MLKNLFLFFKKTWIVFISFSIQKKLNQIFCKVFVGFSILKNQLKKQRA